MIELTQEAFTGMVAIKIEDEYTHQVLVLTPDETAALRDKLNDFSHSDAGDEAKNREARRMKGLTLYNGHSLPYINREKFEAENHVTVTFALEVLQTNAGLPDEPRVIARL